jgi:hypothetical protein
VPQNFRELFLESTADITEPNDDVVDKLDAYIRKKYKLKKTEEIVGDALKEYNDKWMTALEELKEAIGTAWGPPDENGVMMPGPALLCGAGIAFGAGSTDVKPVWPSNWANMKKVALSDSRWVPAYQRSCTTACLRNR